jgi:site-specific DNA recombinase
VGAPRRSVRADRTRREGRVHVLLVAKLDRLSRDHPSLVVLERRLQKHQVEVVSVAEQNGDGPLAEYIRAQVALVAQLERSMILERVNAGKARAKRDGRHVHGRIPYGYRSAGGGKLAIHTYKVDREKTSYADEAAIVRRIFTDARDGWNPGRIARELNRDGIPAAQGGPWSYQVVRGILRNPVYAGERYGVRGAQPAIVSRRLWNAAQRA